MKFFKSNIIRKAEIGEFSGKGFYFCLAHTLASKYSIESWSVEIRAFGKFFRWYPGRHFWFLRDADNWNHVYFASAH